MFENPSRGRQARNFTTNVPKILDLKSSSEQIFLRKLSLGAPGPSQSTRIFFSVADLVTGSGLYDDEPKNDRSRNYCKADRNHVDCFFITIFRLAIPALFRFTMRYEKAIHLVTISFAVAFGLLVFRFFNILADKISFLEIQRR